MTSPPLDSTHGRTTLGVACNHHLWAAHTVEQRGAWHAINALGLHAQTDDIARGMTSPPLDGKQGRTTSGVACHHRLWAAHTVERHRAWHAIIAYGRRTRSNDVRLDMPSPPLDSRHGRTTSGRACYHRLWTAHTVKRRRAWHDITSFGQHTRSNDVGRDISSPPLDSAHSRKTSRVACNHHLWAAHTV